MTVVWNTPELAEALRKFNADNGSKAESEESA